MRTHLAGELNAQNLQQSITVCGWVQRRRDHGGVIFVDLRDHSGLLQIVFDPSRAAIFSQAEDLRSEYVVQARGSLRPRPEGTINPSMATGEVELLVEHLQLFSPAKTPPFGVDEHSDLSDDVRLAYRVVDLRRPAMQQRLRTRAAVVARSRRLLEEHGFVDIETPTLTRATPEGARDYLVPSRTQPGKFFALPQSPQLFKQLLMLAGFDRYYQVVKCFRDEDLRSDRQPEFTQIDLETSFTEAESIRALVEELLRTLFAEFAGVDLPPFPCMSYAEAMRRYGSDKPDLRNPLELVEIADLVATEEFKVFSAPAQQAGCRVVAMRVPAGAALSRKQIDDYTKLVGKYGAKGLAWIKVNDIAAGVEGLQSPIVKFLSPACAQAIVQRVAAQDGDLIFFGADQAKVVNQALGNPLQAPAQAYDVVINGVEIGGGSMRIYQREMQEAVLQLLDIDAAAAQEKLVFCSKPCNTARRRTAGSPWVSTGWWRCWWAPSLSARLSLSRKPKAPPARSLGRPAA